ncbi:MAG TPA: zf-HC2 domain-containing protein [Gemmatimonadaceae bacterium]|nr:zf-HC2 domain-containing protein [Gemmatimonadaceae bacterium]
MREHPAEGELQALLDGELARARVIVVRAHLLRCESCRARAEAARATSAMVNSLLRRSTPTVDSASAWERLMVRSGGRAEAQERSPMRWTSAAALALATAALIVTMVRSTSLATPGDDAFALVREAQAHPAQALLRDACCSDHDGGDRPDDGLLTLSTVGEKVTVVIVYEDVDHTGTFTHGDIVRYVSTIPHSASTAPLTH